MIDWNIPLDIPFLNSNAIAMQYSSRPPQKVKHRVLTVVYDSPDPYFDSMYMSSWEGTRRDTNQKYIGRWEEEVWIRRMFEREGVSKEWKRLTKGEISKKRGQRKFLILQYWSSPYYGLHKSITKRQQQSFSAKFRSLSRAENCSQSIRQNKYSLIVENSQFYLHFD